MSDVNGQLPASELAPIQGGQFLLRSDAAAAFNAMCKEHVVRVRDAYRVLGHPGDNARGVWSQWCAWERYEAGGNLAARPGTSNHGLGTAIDCESESDRATVDRIGSKYGYSKAWSDAPGEWWHILYQPGHYAPAPADPYAIFSHTWWPFAAGALADGITVKRPVHLNEVVEVSWADRLLKSPGANKQSLAEEWPKLKVLRDRIVAVEHQTHDSKTGGRDARRIALTSRMNFIEHVVSRKNLSRII